MVGFKHQYTITLTLLLGATAFTVASLWRISVGIQRVRDDVEDLIKVLPDERTIELKEARQEIYRLAGIKNIFLYCLLAEFCLTEILFAFKIASERQARALVDQQNRANREKVKLAAGIAHDVGNRLQPILSAAELIQRYGKQERWINQIIKNVKSIRQLSNDLMLIYRIQEKERVSFELRVLSEITQKVVEDMRCNYENRKIVFGVKEEPQEPIFLNTHLAESAIYNLLLNAIKYSEDDTSIFVFVKDNTIIEVGDCGQGIPEEKVLHLLEPFNRGNKGSGTGLGLAVIKGCADIHDGILEVKSYDEENHHDLVLELEGNFVRTIFKLQFPDKTKNRNIKD